MRLTEGEKKSEESACVRAFVWKEIQKWNHQNPKSDLNQMAELVMTLIRSELCVCVQNFLITPLKIIFSSYPRSALVRMCQHRISVGVATIALATLHAY